MIIMKTQVLFIHGGDEDGYGAAKKMAASLTAALGSNYEVNYPQMESDESVSDFGWPQQIDEYINKSEGNIILVGHSLGASTILRYLSETDTRKKISGVFLLAPPFWSGDEDWKKGLILQDGFAGKLPANTPIFLYYCLDDDVVPFDQFSSYRQKMPQATFRQFKKGGHQFNDDLTLVAEDIKQLQP